MCRNRYVNDIDKQKGLSEKTQTFFAFIWLFVNKLDIFLDADIYCGIVIFFFG